jgi:hypothetical protein
MPRSPSRDLSDRYTGKRGYFRTPEAVRRGKYILAALALIGAVAWAGVDVAGPPHARYAHTHGPLSNPHAVFDDNCAACHETRSAKEFSVSGIFNTRDRWHSFTCEKCHAGPIHHASATEKAKEFHNVCSNCHHDHLGRLNSLVRLSDADCTQCHTDLGKWHDAAKSLTQKEGKLYQNSITNFVTNHPEFRSLDVARPGRERTLTFSHAVHMNPGQTYTPSGKEAMTSARIRELNPSNPAVADRYRLSGQSENAPVQLDCASCHKLDSGIGTQDYDSAKTAMQRFNEPARAILKPRQAGAYYLPVNFEEHCRACHPLHAPGGTTASGDTKLVIPGFDVPHRRQPSELLGDLGAGYLKGMIAENHPALRESPGPGGKLDAPPEGNKRGPSLGDEADRLAKVAQRQLFSNDSGCAKCHRTTGTIDGKDNNALRVSPVLDRTVWFQHAKFNHSSHRGATCASCHPGTAARTIASVDANRPEPVQILGVESCRACHSPSRTKVKLPDGSDATGGGIRHNCTDCHSYHHGDLPMQGRGSETWTPKEQLDIKDWLRGIDKPATKQK